MRPRTLLTLAVLAWILLSVLEHPSREWHQQELVNVCWAAGSCCRHAAWQVGLGGLLVWHLLGDALGRGGKGGGGRD